MRGVLYVDRQDTETVKLPGATRDWQVRCVCGGTHLTCNGGWMKRIEDAAKPAMAPLLKGEETRLSPAQQGAIATWAALKCIVAECAYDGRPITHYAQRKRLMRLRVPPTRGWAVWIGHFERRRWTPEFVQWPFQVSGQEEARRRRHQTPTYYNSNSLTQVVGNLFVHVMHCPSRVFVERWRFALPDDGTLYRIWPPSGHSIKWPGRTLTDHDAAVAANAVRDFLLGLRRTGRA